MNFDLKIDWLGGNCPVQAEGSINGLPLYFRSRGQRWALYITLPDGVEWEYSEPFGDTPYSAGWMSEEVAHQCIAKGLIEYFTRPTK